MKINSLAVIFIITNSLLGGSYASGQTLSTDQVSSFSSLPASEACRLIDYDNIEIVGGFINDTWILAVDGEKPWLTMEVLLAPYVYVDQPDYWAIDLVGCQSGVGLPVTSPFSVTLQADTLGKLGVEVRSASRTERLQVPPR